MTTPTFRDVEQISALLDGQLPQAEAARLQMLIASDREMAAVYQQLSQSRALLRRLPARRAPRNFTLTPKMAGIKAPTPRAFPVFRFASAFASLLLLLTFAANAFGAIATVNLAAAPAAAPVEAYGKGGGPMAEDTANTRPQSGGGNAEEPTLAPAPTQAPMMAAAPAATEAPAAPAATAALKLQNTLAPTATLEVLRMASEPSPEPTGVVEMAAPKQSAEPGAPEQPPAAAPQPATLIPGWLQIGLLVVALLAGGAAWFVYWKANADFSRKSRK